MDIIALRRDFDFVIVGAIDVQELISILDTNMQHPVGFKAAVENFLHYKNINKEIRNHDWRQRPLPQSMLKYARDDSHLLFRLWEKLRTKVV